jgi:hypothetical protein
MSIAAIRFRNEGALVVLEVLVGGEYDGFSSRRDATWRDAVTGDLLEVAAYTRAHDSLSTELESMRNVVGSLQGDVSQCLSTAAAVLERDQRR